jgi:hypothetical protein
MSIVIEKGIPLPEGLRPKCLGLAQLVKQLEVGDSFLVPNAKITSLKTYCSKLGAQNAIRLAARAVEGGVRVWRVL